MSENDKMFRYLLKYVGKYRVLTELTTNTNDFVRNGEGEIHPDYDELYIPCAYDGKIKHTYNDSVLAYFIEKPSTFKRIIKELTDSNIKFEIDENIDGEFIIYFSDNDMDLVAKLVGAKTTGKKIHPFDEKNVPDRIENTGTVVTPLSINYKIPSQDMSLYYKAISTIKDTKTKREFNKAAPDKFIESLKNEGVRTSLEKSMLPVREYIHYSGMWDKFLNFIKEEALLV